MKNAHEEKDSIAKILEEWRKPVEIGGRAHHIVPNFDNLHDLYTYLKVHVKRQGKTSRFTNIHPYEHLQGQKNNDPFSLRQKRRAMAARSREIEFLKRIREYKKANRKVV